MKNEAAGPGRRNEKTPILSKEEGRYYPLNYFNYAYLFSNQAPGKYRSMVLRPQVSLSLPFSRRFFYLTHKL